jgi:hypothetical protein
MTRMCGQPSKLVLCPGGSAATSSDGTGSRRITGRAKTQTTPNDLTNFGRLAAREPVSGIEPLTCRLQESRPRALYALAAPMTHVIALTALTALGLSRAPFHEPFHADDRQ